MTTQTSSRANRPPVQLWSVPVAAELLGCSEMHVYRLVSTGELRAVDISRKGAGKSKTRIRSDDLDTYIGARTRRADPSGASGDDLPAAILEAPGVAPARPSRRPSPKRRVRAEADLDPSPAA